MFPRMSRLERDITLVGAAVVSVAGLIGGLIGWVAHQLLVHLHHEGRSEHFQQG
jgi:hypothetical protein